MSFGRNPHVAKAEAAEQRAGDAHDEPTRVRAHREAAHQWDRAAEREKPGKRRDEYAANAARNRALADGEASEDERAGDRPVGDGPADALSGGPLQREPVDRDRLN